MHCKKKKIKGKFSLLQKLCLKLHLLLSMSLIESLLLDLQSSVSNSDSHKEHFISDLLPSINTALNFSAMSMTNLYLFLSLFAEYFSVDFFLEHVKNCKSNVIRKLGFQNSKDCWRNKWNRGCECDSYKHYHKNNDSLCQYHHIFASALKLSKFSFRFGECVPNIRYYQIKLFR